MLCHSQKVLLSENLFLRFVIRLMRQRVSFRAYINTSSLQLLWILGILEASKKPSAVSVVFQAKVPAIRCGNQCSPQYCLQKPLLRRLHMRLLYRWPLFTHRQCLPQQRISAPLQNHLRPWFRLARALPSLNIIWLIKRWQKALREHPLKPCFIIRPQPPQLMSLKRYCKMLSPLLQWIHFLSRTFSITIHCPLSSH